MSARPGGEAAKFGHRYEGAWTVRHLLFVLGGHAEAITLEDVGELGQGSEFTFYLHDGNVEVHQVKRRDRDANGWTPQSLHSRGVFNFARHHVDQGRRFHFVSEIPAPKIDKLCHRASQASDLRSFLKDWVPAALLPEFTYLSSTVFNSDHVALKVLRGMSTTCEGEASIRRVNEVLAALYLDGAPPRLATLGLGDLAEEALGVPLSAAKIKERLGDYGLRFADRIGSPTRIRAAADSLASWKGSVERGLLRPMLPRAEVTALADAVRTRSERVHVVSGTAGSGKSAVLFQAVEELEAENWAVLGFRLDRIDSFASTTELGEHIGLGMSPVAALAAAADQHPSLLVIDQLDAVSLASGRGHHRFDVIADLVREARAFPPMRVLLACRAFDIDNDHRIRKLVSSEGVARQNVTSLSDEQIDAAVTQMGLSSARLTDAQRALLESPFNLVLLAAVARDDDPLAFSSDNDLLNRYWDRKQDDCQSRWDQKIHFATAIEALVDDMSANQTLSAPITVLDVHDLGHDAKVLASEHVLVRDRRRYAFFHERFFDYAFARLWINRNETLVDFLLPDDQELFRRAQVRQILQYIRDEDPNRFIREVVGLLDHQEIRFHIKTAVFAVLRALSNPSADEWRLIERFLLTDGPFTPHLMNTIRTLPWFDRLDEEGVIAAWLATRDDSIQDRIKDVLLGAVKERPDRMAALIAPYAGQTPHYVEWLAWITRFARVHNSRPLFELVLEALRCGDFANDGQLDLTIGGLGQQKPVWAVEFLAAWFVERTAALALNTRGNVIALKSRQHNLLELIRAAADQAAAEFCQAMVPYLLTVMSLTETGTGDQPITDGHFSFRHQPAGHLDEADEVLLHATAAALRTFVTQDPDAARPLLELLADDPHDSAQWLLYEALRTDGSRWAEWSASLLLEGERRFLSGYLTDEWRTTRQLVQVITPHVSDEDFISLETALMNLQPSWESRLGAGWSSFALLGAMASDRLSTEAKRRLGELRRRFQTDEPAIRLDLVGGAIASPIPEEAAKRMNDDQWIRAMSKHCTDKTDLDSLTGGVRELSQVLRTEARNNPSRFAHLALRLTDCTATNYSNAILQGIGDTKMSIDPEAVFDAVRHIASLGNPDNDQWLSWSLSRLLDSEIPDDIISIILDRALHATDPSEEFWPEPAGEDEDSDDYIDDTDVYGNGMNTARGSAALMLGNIVVHDTDGHRTRLIEPALDRLTNDPSLAVRSCVARLIAACLRHANETALTAFARLVAAEDLLLTARPVTQLMSYVGLAEPAMIEPVIRRMLDSSNPNIRRAGGAVAAYAGLALGLDRLLTVACMSSDAPTRRGAAETCARMLPRTTDVPATCATLGQFFNDPDGSVRKTAAQVAGVLRGQDLRPFRDMLIELIESPAFIDALAQLRLTLQNATDRIDDIVLAYARRFIDEQGQQAGDYSTAAAGEAPSIANLTLRAYAQAPDRASRNQTLDLIDELLLIDAIGAAEAVDAAKR